MSTKTSQSSPPTIFLAGREYPVRASESILYIKDRGHWLKTTSFVNRLVDEGRTTELADLVAVGVGKLTGRLIADSPRETAKALHGAREN